MRTATTAVAGEVGMERKECAASSYQDANRGNGTEDHNSLTPGHKPSIPPPEITLEELNDSDRNAHKGNSTQDWPDVGEDNPHRGVR